VGVILCFEVVLHRLAKEHFKLTGVDPVHARTRAGVLLLAS